MRYRQKSELVAAVQWDPTQKPTRMPDWLWARISGNPLEFDQQSGNLGLETGEGYCEAQPGDWIILWPNGNIFVLSDRSFRMQYESAEPVPRRIT